ncbi:MAG: carbon-nitrogen hydrolase family protein [Ferroplasma sp.]|uniref:carbon-nitrogen hydrolase family protein n=1 Tax=Ferroplasma sp. TaxID=2591003 RepID=UPI0028153BD7|nr:carbon-nitrogen hydrolase family protein [Ferroplasma sp.]WMT52069.1 MAG: carbon-nitrogen hydrolase family protein [Ferroplasma sp.]
MLKIALTQLRPVADKDISLRNIEYYSGIAASNSSELIVFPEYYMFYSPYRDAVIKNSESLNGNYVRRLKEISQNNRISIIAGINEVYDGNYYDTAVFIQDGELSNYYRKSHLYDAFGYKESDIYTYGNGPFKISRVGGVNFGMLICYDIRFPEVFRNYSMNDADIIILISAWFAGTMKEEQWLSLVSVRALENTVYLATSNMVGGGFTGISSFTDPIGAIRARAAEDEDIVYATVDLERIAAVRKKMPVLRQRRPELYKL